MKFHQNLVDSANAEHRIMTISDSIARIGPLKSDNLRHKLRICMWSWENSLAELEHQKMISPNSR